MYLLYHQHMEALATDGCFCSKDEYTTDKGLNLMQNFTS